MKEIKITSGITGTLLIVFIILKLTAVIDWSWVWVLAPLWVDIVLALSIAVFAVFVARKMR